MRHGRLIALSIVVTTLCVVTGVIIGYFAHPFYSENSGRSSTTPDDTISSKLITRISADNIRKYTRTLTEVPHVAGSAADVKQAKDIESYWTEVGLDDVRQFPYDVMLSYPDTSNISFVRIVDKINHKTSFKTNPFVKAILHEQNHSDVLPPYNAFSPSGLVRGELVYAHYAREKDFAKLTKDYKINLTNKIILARYGKIFRGDKVRFAAENKAAGVILYSDPQDYVTPSGSDVYPQTLSLPGSGVQFGTLILPNGDPRTPGYPSTKRAYIPDPRKIDLPQIPAYPISYKDAKYLLESLSGEVAPLSWQGDLDLTYRLGPGLKDHKVVELFVNNQEDNVTIQNVVGLIRGKLEPDRYVILGNHRDSWMFGAIDSSSTHASMMELSRTIMTLVKDGWRPRRSILFCSWGGEEQGMMGSSEWVENFMTVLRGRAVAYLNVDGAVRGNFSLRAFSSPLLHQLLEEATKKVPNPDPNEMDKGRKTVYDTWLLKEPEVGANGFATARPNKRKIAANSDYAAFQQIAGIPSSDHKYTFDKSSGLASALLYHTLYDSFHLIDKIMDKGFHFHEAVTQVWGEMVRSLADEIIIPFNVTDYAIVLKRYYKNLIDGYEELQGDDFVHGVKRLKTSINIFSDACREFEKRLCAIDVDDVAVVRQINDQVMMLEKAFIVNDPVTDRESNRHMILAPNLHENRADDTFPGLVDALFELDLQDSERIEQVKKHLSILGFAIESAASVLRDPAEPPN